jgi:hypothetical protein
MRNLKELYEIVWKEIKDKDFIYSICSELIRLEELCIFSEDEHQLILNHFKSQRYLHSEFMTAERNWKLKGPYWWTAKEDENPINRKAFIQKIISTL